MHEAIQAVVGFMIAISAGAAWRYWEIDGFVALMFSLAGLSLVMRAFGISF